MNGISEILASQDSVSHVEPKTTINHRQFLRRSLSFLFFLHFTTSSSSLSSQEMSETPDNANEECVGPAAENAGKASSCAGCPNASTCASGEGKKLMMEQQQKQNNNDLNKLSTSTHHTILVLSGKGGVGKSTMSTQIAFTLASRGYNVGLLDVDICGPSAPRMLGALGRTVHQSGSGWSPVYVRPNLCVMSISFLLPHDDSAVIWRGPRKNGMIQQFLKETNWGEEEKLDYVIVDTPPGTSDEHITTVQMLANNENTSLSGAIVVTTPEEVSMADVRKELNFCKKTKVKVLGVVENMSELKLKLQDFKFYKKEQKLNNSEEDNNDDTKETECTEYVLNLIKEKCPELLEIKASVDIFSAYGDGPKGMAKQFNVPYLGKIPLDPKLLKCCEEGKCFVESEEESEATEPMHDLVDNLIDACPIPGEEDGGGGEDTGQMMDTTE